MLLGTLCGGWMMAKSAGAAQSLLDQQKGDATFLNTKILTANIYLQQILPRIATYAAQINCGEHTVLAMDPEMLAR